MLDILVRKADFPSWFGRAGWKYGNFEVKGEVVRWDGYDPKEYLV
jgi:hypothetical protein